MTRFLVLLILIAWFAADASAPPPLPMRPIQTQILIFGGFGLIVLIPALWSRVLARYVTHRNLYRSLNRYSRVTAIARLMIPLWFAFCLFALGWSQIVYTALGPIGRWPVSLPAAVCGTLPPLVAWAAMWWAAYPADRALREQSLLFQLRDDLPIHSPPVFWSYFTSNLRMQLLFTIVPVGLILFLRDIVSLVLALGFHINLRAIENGSRDPSTLSQIAQYLILPLCGFAVFVFAPEILRRVLKTKPLPDSPLRQRLEIISRRAKLKYRDILLWQTGNNVGNAAVMGVVPQVRYILLSDLLIETMTDAQIEAVFAHEVGHLVHRHIAWYGVFVVIAIIVEMMCATLADALPLKFDFIPSWLKDPLSIAAAVAFFMLMFGLLSRWFERQADVFAARTMQDDDPPETLVADLLGTPLSPQSSVVGTHGANLFASALQRVAVVNNIPIRARNFSHGSIAQRMIYLRKLSADASQTEAFDRFMSRVFKIMLAALIASIGWVAFILRH